ncbi:Spc98 family-domain-containing protein [Cantharellus anzutake]|uniref:Spc98 family-domain-containing protein n=1 Tax=Cantharellus anzutake TaxID=1750568 RepID=UPI001903C505|nr:Spc98 family-domain-containing protein [Cantharellus anzutake]KAF8333155.1 Spc98 family-domain-containing protein [Cantharellus anzutake]
MISEIILVLAGHPSSLFLDGGTGKLSPVWGELLHPGEQQSLEYLSHIGLQYRRLKEDAKSIATDSEYVASMCASIRTVLAEYDALTVQTETNILQRDDTMVAGGCFVPLASLKATFSSWDAPFAALISLISQIRNFPSGSISPGQLIDLLLERSDCGVEKIREIMVSLAETVQKVWRMHLVAYVVHGTLSERDSFALGNPFRLNLDVIPKCVSEETRESIAYVGRAMTTIRSAKSSSLQARGVTLPRELAVEHTKLLGKVLPQDSHAFSDVMVRIRSNVSEWLWTTVLTHREVNEAIDTLADYFLTRNGEFSVALIQEVERLKVSRLSPRSSSRTPGLSIIREQDLALCILRASLGTSAEHDPAVSQSRLRFKLPGGSLRPHLPHVDVDLDLSHITPRSMDFSTTLLGVPLELTYSLSWPLDLFLAPSDIQTYSQLFAYFASIRYIYQRVMSCWASLSSSQRRRRRWAGLKENGNSEDDRQRRLLLRDTWEAVRLMLWFWDNLWSYMCLDVVEGHFKRLKGVLQPSRHRSGSVRRRRSSSASTAAPPPAPPTTEGHEEMETSEFGPSRNEHPSARGGRKRLDKDIPSPSLDFATLRALHGTYLYSLTTGSLLTNSACSSTIKTIMDICEVFVAKVERWGGNVLPALLEEGSIGLRDGKIGGLVSERRKVVRNVNEGLRVQLETFQEQLSASLSSHVIFQSGEITSNTTFFPGPTVNGKGAENVRVIDALIRRSVERLLLRLDFNEFTRPAERRAELLREAGLA